MQIARHGNPTQSILKPTQTAPRRQTRRQNTNAKQQPQKACNVRGPAQLQIFIVTSTLTRNKPGHDKQSANNSPLFG